MYAKGEQLRPAAALLRCIAPLAYVHLYNIRMVTSLETRIAYANGEQLQPQAAFQRLVVCGHMTCTSTVVAECITGPTHWLFGGMPYHSRFGSVLCSSSFSLRWLGSEQTQQSNVCHHATAADALYHHENALGRGGPSRLPRPPHGGGSIAPYTSASHSGGCACAYHCRRPLRCFVRQRGWIVNDGYDESSHPE